MIIERGEDLHRDHAGAKGGHDGAIDPAARSRSRQRSDAKWIRTGTERVAGAKREVLDGVGTENGKPKEADLGAARGFGSGSGSMGGGSFSEALTEYANPAWRQAKASSR